MTTHPIILVSNRNSRTASMTHNLKISKFLHSCCACRSHRSNFWSVSPDMTHARIVLSRTYQIQRKQIYEYYEGPIQYRFGVMSWK